jgi:hypothetical protein
MAISGGYLYPADIAQLEREADSSLLSRFEVKDEWNFICISPHASRRGSKHNDKFTHIDQSIFVPQTHCRVRKLICDTGMNQYWIMQPNY